MNRPPTPPVRWDTRNGRNLDIRVSAVLIHTLSNRSGMSSGLGIEVLPSTTIWATFSIFKNCPK
jgi:hypothetical protein